ncbi:MAG: FAD-binding protein [Acidimicrobiales bacterium]
MVHAIHPDVVTAAMSLAGERNGPGRRGLIARGLGRSYGDAAQNAGGSVLDATWLDGVHQVDLERGLATVGAGISFETLMARFIPLGWFVPVTPGTRQITVGGAVAADVHGKNHHVDGSFCSHVREIDLMCPTGPVTVSAESDRDLFWATAGGMGLTGVVTRATLQMIPIESSFILVDTERVPDLDSVMDAMRSGDAAYRYSVAWIDCQTTGRHLGRSVLTRGDHARLEDLPDRLRTPQAGARSFVPRTIAGIPIVAPGGLLNPVTVGLFNEFWFRKAPAKETGRPHTLASFFHPLDIVTDWNRLYGPRGFLQYQFVVPDAEGETVRTIIERLAEVKVASFLAVLKRFGPSDPGPLSFPIPGWTLALDLPVGYPDLDRLLDGLDELVIGAGGRVYLAKDSRLSKSAFRTMYPRVDEFLDVRARVDPEGLLRSDLGRRLGLCDDPTPTARTGQERPRGRPGTDRVADGSSGSAAKATGKRAAGAAKATGKRAAGAAKATGKRVPRSGTAGGSGAPKSEARPPDPGGPTSRDRSRP